MANRIKIRHGNSVPQLDLTTNPPIQDLLPYELGWDGTALYINDNNNTIKRVGDGVFLPLAGGIINGDITVNGGITASNFIGSLQGNASSATYASYASYVRMTATIPTSDTTYYLTFTTGTAANTDYVLRGNSMFRAWITANGDSALRIGNSSHNGGLHLYSSGGKYLNLKTSTMSSTNKTITFPDITGTVALISDLNNYLPLTGGTLTSNLTINNSTQDTGLTVTSGNNTNISVTCTNQTYNTIQLRTGSSTGHHGIYSLGYGTTQDGKWIIYRNGSDGKVYLQTGLSGNIVWSDKGRRIFVQTGTSVPSDAVNGDIVLVKV